jgi:serine/threonine-protein kinase
MDEFCTELEGCLAELDGRDGEGATMIVPPPARPRRTRRQRERRRSPVGIALIVLLAALLVAGGAYLLLSNESAKKALHVASAPSKPVQLQGLTAYDPEGDNSEHDDDAAGATDRNPSTAWTTEEYQPGGFTKTGVGLVLRAPRRVALGKMTVNGTGTPFTAVIEGSDSPDAGYVTVSDRKDVAGSTTFSIDTNGQSYRYYMVWLRLPSREGQAAISEVRART